MRQTPRYDKWMREYGRWQEERNAEIRAGLLRRATAVGVVVAKMGIPESMQESAGLTFPTKLYYVVEGVKVVIEVAD